MGAVELVDDEVIGLEDVMLEYEVEAVDISKDAMIRRRWSGTSPTEGIAHLGCVHFPTAGPAASQNEAMDDTQILPEHLNEFYSSLILYEWASFQLESRNGGKHGRGSKRS
jgi:hypothetical protein